MSQVEANETESSEPVRLSDQPNLTPSQSERLISTYGVEFVLPNVVNSGDTFTEQQAKFFNIQYHGFAVKSFANRLKEMIEAGKSWEEMNTAFQDHCANYEWRPRGDGTGLDPIESEMFRLARDAYNGVLAARGEKSLRALVRAETITKEEADSIVEGVMAKNYEALKQKVLARRAEAANFAQNLSI